MGFYNRDSSCRRMPPYVKSNCNCRPKTGNDTLTIPSSASLAQPRSNSVYEISGNETKPVKAPGPHAPIWQVYPPNNQNAFVMYDLFSDPIAKRTLETMVASSTTISKTYGRQKLNLWNFLEDQQLPTWGDLMFSPVFGADGNEVIGSIVLDFDFRFVIGSSVPVESNGIHIVLDNTCGQKRTFVSDGSNINFVGDGDLHDPKYTSMVQSSSFDDYLQTQRSTSPEYPGGDFPMNCAYRILVYPSDEFKSTYISNKPGLYAMSVGLIFAFTSLLFITYDCYVARRQRSLMQAALQRDEIVSSLFPAAVRERLFLAEQQHVKRYQQTPRGIHRRIARFLTPSYNMLENFRPASERITAIDLPRSEPIADFLPMVSVVFADISGFTAWSSEREPSQVFQLLETVYQTFDRIALQCGIFKIETIGDCYVAATCIPVYQNDHAVRIVKFAHSCLLHMHELTHDLETTLGPSTSSLSIRIGIHSGPVIAGVLRGGEITLPTLW